MSEERFESRRRSHAVESDPPNTGAESETRDALPGQPAVEVPADIAAEASAARSAATVALLGGLMLSLLAIFSAGLSSGGEQIACYLFAAAGAISFLIGGQTAVKGALPGALVRLLERPAAYLGVTYAQIFLLLFALPFALLARFAAGNDLLARSAPLATGAWLLALLCAAAGSLETDHPLRVNITRGDILFTAALLAAALLLRGLATDQIPTTLSGDEGASGLSAAQFAAGEANNLFTVAWFDFPSLYFALQGAGVALLGHTIPALRISSALAGALTVVAVYWLGRVTFDVTMARIASLLLLASHYHIHFSRIGLNNVWDGLLAVLAAAGLWYGWKSGRRLGFVLAGICLGLGQYFYVTMRAMPLIFLVWAAGALLAQRTQFRARLPGLLLCAYIALIAALPILFFFATHRDQLNARTEQVSALGPWLDAETTATGDSELAVMGRQFAKAARGLVIEPLRLLYDPGAPLLLPVSAALFIIGVAWALLNFDLRYYLLILPVLVTLLIVTVSQSAPSSQRYIMAAPFVIIFVALPLSLLTGWLRGLWPEYKKAAAVPAVLLVAWIMAAETGFYFTRAYDSYVLGGLNTAVASEMALDLQDEDRPFELLFYGAPRMGYRSHGSVPFLVPDLRGQDVAEGDLFPPNWTANGRTVFIFLPERVDQLAGVRAAFPDGEVQEQYFQGDLLYTRYTVE